MKFSNLARYSWIWFMIILLAFTACTEDDGGDGDSNTNETNGTNGENNNGTSGSNAPEDVVEKYLQAQVDSDADTMRQLACAAWEGQALLQAQSFVAVDATLVNMACRRESGNDEEVVVTCDGTISVVYDGENTQDIELRSYVVRQEDGEWKFCGESGGVAQPEARDLTPAIPAVEAYLQAMVLGNAQQMTALSCTGRTQAIRSEVGEFGGANATLENMSCSIAGEDQDGVRVTCQGNIVFPNETRPLSTYYAIEENNGWKFCGEVN